MKVSVGELLRNTPGSQVEHTLNNLDELPLGSNEFTISPDSAIESLIIRVPDGVAFVIPYAEIEIEVNCDRCLKKFKQTITINNAEQLFYTHTLEDVEPDEHEYELISNKYQEIDVTDFLIDTIALAVPITLICDEACAGIPYKKDDQGGSNPFSQLKD